MPDRDLEDLRAGNDFLSDLVDRADLVLDGAPLWYGWAIMEAFLAGIDYSRAQNLK